MKYSRALIVCVAIMLVVIIIFITDNYVPVLARKYYVYSFVSCATDNGADFEDLVRKATIKTIKEESWNAKPLATRTTMSSYLLRNKTSVFDYGEYALLLHYAYQYADVKGDKEIKELVKNKLNLQTSCMIHHVYQDKDQLQLIFILIHMMYHTRSLQI